MRRARIYYRTFACDLNLRQEQDVAVLTTVQIRSGGSLFGYPHHAASTGQVIYAPRRKLLQYCSSFAHSRRSGRVRSYSEWARARTRLVTGTEQAGKFTFIDASQV